MSEATTAEPMLGPSLPVDVCRLGCPHCGTSLGAYVEDLPWNEDETREFSCGNCGEDFVVRPNIRVRHETAKTEDDF